MRMLLTPVGPSDPLIKAMEADVVRPWLPSGTDITVGYCEDGKLGPPVVPQYYTRLFIRMLEKRTTPHNSSDAPNQLNSTPTTVQMIRISFFDDTQDELDSKLARCDILVMLGFVPGHSRTKQIFDRRNTTHMLMRMAVANKVVTNKMSYWGVCGSAVCAGDCWRLDSSMPEDTHQLFEMLGDCHVNYQAGAAPDVITMPEDDRELIMTPGIGIMISTGEDYAVSRPFVTVFGKRNSNYWAWKEKCGELEPILQQMVLRLSRLRSVYRSAPEASSARWELHWGTGHCRWIPST